MSSRSPPTAAQLPQFAAKLASWVSGWIVIVGSTRTGNCRPGEDSHARSTVTRTASHEPRLRTDSSACGRPGGGGMPGPRPASVASGACSTNTGPPAGARNTCHDPSGSRRAVSRPPPPRARTANRYEAGADGLRSTIVSFTDPEATS